MSEDLKNKTSIEETSFKEKFEAMAEASPDCIKLFDLDNKILFLNRAGLEEHGFKSLDDVIGFDWVKCIVPEQREMVLEKIKECVQNKKSVTFDIKHLPEFANREWDSLVIYPVFNKNGNVKYFVGISRDISDRKRKETELENLNKLMIGREAKMAELKNKLKELEENLKKS